jgi:hypothetical protein
LAALARPEDAHEGVLTQEKRERRQKYQRFDRIVVVGRKRPRRGISAKSPPRKTLR